LPLQGADGFGVFLPEALLRVEVSCPFGAKNAGLKTLLNGKDIALRGDAIPWAMPLG